MAENTRPVLRTLCIRMDTTVEEIDYEPVSFFGEGGASIEMSLDLKDYFEEQIGIRCDILKTGVGQSNPMAEYLFTMAHKRKWGCMGDCVIFAGRSLSEAEIEKIKDYLKKVRKEIIDYEKRRQEEENAFWEYIYDTEHANSLAIAPDGKMSGIRLPVGDMEESAGRYFSAISDEAYPVRAEGSNYRILNESLAGQFRVAMIYDKMSSFMDGCLNPFGCWMAGEEDLCGDLILMGEREDGSLRRLKTEELAVLVHLVEALKKQRDGNLDE